MSGGVVWTPRAVRVRKEKSMRILLALEQDVGWNLTHVGGKSNEVLGRRHHKK